MTEIEGQWSSLAPPQGSTGPQSLSVGFDHNIPNYSLRQWLKQSLCHTISKGDDVCQGIPKERVETCQTVSKVSDACQETPKGRVDTCQTVGKDSGACQIRSQG